MEEVNISKSDLEILANAKWQLENIGWAMEGLNKMGNLIESRVQMLPKKQQTWLQDTSYKVLLGVLRTNLWSMKASKTAKPSRNFAYKALVTTSGALGGAFGATAFVADLGVSTQLILRSIMEIAREQGEDLSELDAQLACVQVFGLGGNTKHEAGLDTGYYASKIGLQSAIKGGVASLDTLLAGAGGTVMQLLSQIASRFSVQVSEKFVAQAIPVLGAAGGAAINLAFINHFQQIAKAHFSIRRLERKYGKSAIEQQFNSLEAVSKSDS